MTQGELVRVEGGSQQEAGAVATEVERRSGSIRTAVCDALDTRLMRIEAGFTAGFTGLQLIGNTSEVCRDGKERAKAALETLGIMIPSRRLVVSLTPADIKKDGNHFDLPMAVALAILITGKEPRVDPSRWLFAAELGLGGELRPVKGVVSFAVCALASGLEGLVVARQNLAEVEALVRLETPGGSGKRIQAFGFDTLAEVLAWLFEGASPPAVVGHGRYGEPPPPEEVQPNFDDMILTPELELAALTVAAGMHSLLLQGPPGTGKSMFSQRLPSILPRMSPREHVDAMRIHSALSEKLPESLLAGRSPYRAPHHQASAAAVLGSPERPGELSLAHGGVLFLDELPEFRRDLLESLREPLETDEIRVSRTKRKIVWKARVILVAACNNCPCGWYGSRRRRCDCGESRRLAYRQRLSGPVLDRIDLHVNAPESGDDTADLFLRLARGEGESKTRRMAQRVVEARERARDRNRAFGVAFNRDLAAAHLLDASQLPRESFSRLVNETFPKSASSRSVIRALRVARTLADLAGRDALAPEDVRRAWTWQAEKAAEARGEGLSGKPS